MNGADGVCNFLDGVSEIEAVGNSFDTVEHIWWGAENSFDAVARIRGVGNVW